MKIKHKIGYNTNDNHEIEDTTRKTWKLNISDDTYNERVINNVPSSVLTKDVNKGSSSIIEKEGTNRDDRIMRSMEVNW